MERSSLILLFFVPKTACGICFFPMYFLLREFSGARERTSFSKRSREGSITKMPALRHEISRRKSGMRGVAIGSAPEIGSLLENRVNLFTYWVVAGFKIELPELTERCGAGTDGREGCRLAEVLVEPDAADDVVASRCRSAYGGGFSCRYDDFL